MGEIGQKNKMMRKMFLACGLIMICAAPGYGMSIQEAVKTTFLTNPDFLVQQQQVEIQKERQNQAASGYKPRFDLRGNAGREHTYNEFRKDKDLGPVAGSAVLTQPLFRGFQTTHDLRRTEADTAAAKSQFTGTAQQVALEVIQTYLQVLSAQEVVKISQRNFDNHEKIQVRIQDRFNEGVSDQSEVAHAEGRLALAHSNLLSAQNNLEDAISDFEAVAGFSMDTFDRPVLADDQLPPSREQALKTGEANHPVLQAALFSVTAAQEQHKQVGGRYLPSFDFELKGSASEDADGVEQKEAQASAMLVMNWNIYHGGVDAAEKRATLAQITQAKKRLLRIQRQVAKEVRLAWAALQTTIRQKIYMEDHVRASTKAQRLYIDQFELHRRSLLDLLDTENELFQAKRSYIATDYDELTARYRLSAATGQLLDALELPEPGSE